jgi:hypothetical protein
MANGKTRAEVTAAEKKAIGFDYQYYFFLWKVLSLNTGESVGLEVHDDVHTELDNDEQVLYQLKHTIKVKSDGTPVNLQTLDLDLWKTLSNWALTISDKNDGREQANKQLGFIKKTTFVLASNKSSNSSNELLSIIKSLQSKKATWRDAKLFLETKCTQTQSTEVRSYITDILNLDDDVRNQMFLKIHFELDENDIVKRCKEAIKADKVNESKIDFVFSSIDSAIRNDNFIDIKEGRNIQVSFDDFYTKYRKHYDIARNGELTIEPFGGHMPDRLEQQVFIQQLIEIGDLTESDLDEISRYTTSRLKLENNIDRWRQEGEITDYELENFKDEAKDQWRNSHKMAYRNLQGESSYNDAAIKVVDTMRERMLHISNQSLGTALSNGTFYYLSNLPQIGWRKDWAKYKK